MFICEICGKEFKSLGGLRTHIAQYEKIPIREYLLKYHSEECICPICGKEKKWIRDHFGKTCGDKDCVKKYRELDCLEKYGAKTPLESQIIRDKIKDTNIDKYGSEWYVTTEEFKNKSKETKLDKYGDEFYNNSEKGKQTCLEKYGCEYFVQTDEWKEKNIEACKIKYGVDYYVQTENIRQYRFKELEYDNYIFNSNYEILFYKFCKENDIDVIVHSSHFFEYSHNGKEHLYFPDFKIGDRYIEIKGEHFFDDNDNLINPFTNDEEIQSLYKSKQECMRKNNVLILKSSDIKDSNKLMEILKKEKIKFIRKNIS